MKRTAGWAVLLGFLCAVTACRQGEGGEAAEPRPADGHPAERSPGLALENIEIPLRIDGPLPEHPIRGKALVARLTAGAGKRGGIMKALSPVARAEGTDVTTEGDDLRILSDLPNGVKTLLRLETVEFRGLRVRSRAGVTLLECVQASVGGDEAWELRGAAVEGGTFLSRARLTFSPNGPVRIDQTRD